jgi:hypothetical protein
MDPDPRLLLTDTDPAIFVTELLDSNKKLFFQVFLIMDPDPDITATYFLKVHLHHFFKDKNHKEVTKQ